MGFYRPVINLANKIYSRFPRLRQFKLDNSWNVYKMPHCFDKQSGR